MPSYGSSIRDSRALYYSGELSGGGGNWVDRTARQGSAADHRDEKPHLAKVRVAGSNPVFRSLPSIWHLGEGPWRRGGRRTPGGGRSTARGGMAPCGRLDRRAEGGRWGAEWERSVGVPSRRHRPDVAGAPRTQAGTSGLVPRCGSRLTRRGVRSCDQHVARSPRRHRSARWRRVFGRAESRSSPLRPRKPHA
jgi:hypothetical protein